MNNAGYANTARVRRFFRREAPFAATYVVLKRRLKRVVDIIVSSLGLFVLCPLILGLFALIWFKHGGSPIYRHQRIGQSGRRFDCLKIRSMVLDADAVLKDHLAKNPAARREWTETHKLKDDPRITLIGNLLRKTSLDELPQLYNVLRGDMSLVGPRPIVEAEIGKYGSTFEQCFAVQPGITGLWQVSGRSDCSYADRVAFDLEYATNWRLRLDLLILIRTIPVVMAQRGSR